MQSVFTCKWQLINIQLHISSQFPKKNLLLLRRLQHYFLYAQCTTIFTKSYFIIRKSQLTFSCQSYDFTSVWASDFTVKQSYLLWNYTKYTSEPWSDLGRGRSCVEEVLGLVVVCLGPGRWNHGDTAGVQS